MFEELRYAARSVTRTKRLMAFLLISLALGAGANIAIGRNVYALLFEAPAGVADPATLVSIYTSRSGGATYGPSSYADYATLRARAASFETIAAVDDRAFLNVGFGRAAQRARVAAVSDNFFTMLGMRPHLGRLLEEGDMMLQPQPVVVSFALWQALGGGTDVLNRRLTVGSVDYVVAGVGPRGFRGLQAARALDVWIPLVSLGESSRTNRVMSLLARLKPVVRLDDADREVTRIGADIAARSPVTRRITLAPHEEQPRLSLVAYSRLDPGTRQETTLIAAAVTSTVALLLVSACVNAGNLLISRAAARRREAAVKLALGASRARLFRELLCEGLIISLAAAGLGLVFAAWTTALLPLMFAPEHADLLDADLDVRLLAVTIGVCGVAGVLIGLAPALQVTKLRGAAALRGDSGAISDQHGGRLRAVLVAFQIALSIVLLIPAGLLFRALNDALSGDLGFTARQVAVFAVRSPGSPGSPARGIAYQKAARDSLMRTKGVQSVAWASTLPLGMSNIRDFRIESEATGELESVEFSFVVVSPGYFKTMRLDVLEGRLFNNDDHAQASRVVIVDQLLASHYFNGDVVGRYVRDPAGTRHRIVGVARSGRYRTLQESPRPTVYIPSTQEYVHRGYLLARVTADPSAMLERLTAELKAIDDDAAVVRASTLDADLANALTLDRLTTALVALCGLIALALSTAGVYSVMSDAVLRRTREIGLRVALGADGHRVAKLVCLEAAYPTSAGIAFGVGVTFMTSRIVGAFVYGLPSPDAVTVTGTSAMLSLVVAAAAIQPVRRALRISPGVALRTD